MAINLTRPGIIRNVNVAEVRRWNQHTTDNIERLRRNDGAFAVDVELTHGVEVEVPNPLVDNATPQMVLVDGSAFPVAWRMIDAATIGVTATLPPATPGAAGGVGERIASVVLRAAAVALVTATSKDVTSVTLTPGTWDLDGAIGFRGLTTATSILAQINTTSTAAPSGLIEGDNLFELTVVSANDSSIFVPAWRVSPTVDTTYYLTAYAAFTVSASPGAYGKLVAIRAIPTTPTTTATATLLVLPALPRGS